MKYKMSELRAKITEHDWQEYGAPKALTPITLFQAQLCYLGACLEGRQRVGDKTAREWWNTSDCASDMQWFIDQPNHRLGLFNLSPYREEFHRGYGECDDVKACARIRAEFPFDRIRELMAKVPQVADDSDMPRVDGVKEGETGIGEPMPSELVGKFTASRDFATAKKQLETAKLPFPLIPATARADFEEESQALAKPLPHSPSADVPYRTLGADTCQERTTLPQDGR